MFKQRETFSTKSIFNLLSGQRSTSLQIKDVTWGLCYKGEGVLLILFFAEENLRFLKTERQMPLVWSE